MISCCANGGATNSRKLQLRRGVAALVITGWLVVLALAFLWPEFCGVYICAARFRLLENIEATANIVRKDKANPISQLARKFP